MVYLPRLAGTANFLCGESRSFKRFKQVHLLIYSIGDIYAILFIP